MKGGGGALWDKYQFSQGGKWCDAAGVQCQRRRGGGWNSSTYHCIVSLDHT